MRYQILYKGNVEKDFRRLSKNKEERERIKEEIESTLSKDPFKGKKLKAEYKGLYSLHIRYKVIVVYKIFKENILILGIESRERSYKRRYLQCGFKVSIPGM